MSLPTQETRRFVSAWPAQAAAPSAKTAPTPALHGQTYLGTRVGQGGGALIVPKTENYGENTADRAIANSNFNAFETTLRYSRDRSQFLLSYTYAKSIDQGSNLGEQLNPINPRQSRAISAWDIKHDFVASYTIALPFGWLHRGPAQLVKTGACPAPPDLPQASR